jgi:hypothetical protein
MRPFILPSFLLLLFALACKKPNLDSALLANELDPIVFYTSLKDTLPVKTYQKLQVEKVIGIKIKNLQGHEVRYFEYEADRDKVLKALSQMPFKKYAILSDTLCRKINFHEINIFNISPTELEASSFFWNVDKNEYDVYACTKSPMKHLVFVNKSTKKILHRIEYIG